MKKRMAGLPTKVRGLGYTLVMWHSWGTSLMHTLPSMNKYPRINGRNYDQRVQFDHGNDV